MPLWGAAAVVQVTVKARLLVLIHFLLHLLPSSPLFYLLFRSWCIMSFPGMMSQCSLTVKKYDAPLVAFADANTYQQVTRPSTSLMPGRLLLKSPKREDALLRPLCSECEIIEWSSFVPRHKADISDMRYTTPLFEVFPEPKPGGFACPVCDLLVDLGQAYVTNNPEMIYVCSAAKVFHSDEVNEALNSHSDVTQWATVLTSGAIGVRPNAVLGILHPDSDKEIYAPRIVNPCSIDYDVIRGWVQRCSAHPNKNCTPSRNKNLPGFKVIHCRSRNVIDAPENCPYVALSYVWGTAQLIRPENPFGRFPATIEDSIVVSLALGFEYLWVDRYVSLAVFATHRSNRSNLL